MRLLLDTVTFLYGIGPFEKLSVQANDLLLDPNNEIYLSTVSTWEIAIKYSMGKLDLGKPPGQLVPEERNRLGAKSLPLDEESTLHLIRLPRLHNDPFDRILICQAMVHGMVLVTPDVQMSRYPVRTAW